MVDNPQGENQPARPAKSGTTRKALARRLRKVEGATIRHAQRFVVKRWSNAQEVRRHIITWIIAIGFIIGATGLQFMWSQAGYRTTKPADTGAYAEAVLGPLNSLDPLFASSSAEESVSQLVFSRLFTHDDTGHLNNDLATGMSVSDDKKTYTVTIRSDAVWQDGEPVTADDVAFTVSLLKNPAVHATITGWDNVTVTALNPTTVSFTLPAVYAAFPEALSTFPIVPQHLLSTVAPSAINESNFSKHPIGSGPFSFQFLQDVDSRNGEEIVHLQRNNEYYRGIPKIDRFQLNVYSSTNDIMSALGSSEVNAATDIDATQLHQVNTNRYTVQTKPINSGVYALFNMASPILKDKSVRQALQLATDAPAIRQALGGTTGADAIPSLDLPFVNGQLTGDVPTAPSYNLSAAKKLLDDDGWKLDGSVRKKDGQELKLAIVTAKDSDLELTLQTLVNQWQQLGVGFTTTIADPNDVAQNFVQTILQPRNYDVLVYPLTIGADPDVFAYWHSSQASQTGRNFSNYSNAISDDALATARARLEPDIRNAKYLIFARQWLSDVPAVGLYQSTIRYVANKSVTALTPNTVLTAPADRYSDVVYWSVGTEATFKTP